MKQRWTFRCYPTPEQEQILAQTFGCTRYVYNWALSERTKAFQRGERMNYAQSSAALTALKRQPETIWLNDVSSIPTQQALRHLQTAFANFFAKRAAYPSFKRKDGRQSAEFTRSGFGFDVGTRRLTIAKVGNLKVKWSRRVTCDPSTVTVIRNPSGRYFVSLTVDVDVAPLAETGQSVGIDFGVARLATLSTGERIANPKHMQSRAGRLALLQKRLAKKQNGSKRRALARRAVARQHEKIGNCRKDALEKLSTRLVKEFDVICIEDLNLRGMVKNHSLARSLSDASIGTAIRMLEEKAERYGKRTVRVDRWFPSSKMCSDCGHINSAVVLGVQQWICPKCNSHHDRDDNAAHNILAAGLAVSAHGDGIRALSASAAKPAVCEVRTT